MSDASAAPFALYVHVPWCRHICPYCDFNVVRNPAPPADDFAARVATELAAHVAAPPWAGRRVQSVAFGGGTPSLLPPRAVATILAAIDHLCGVEAGAEVSLEANPATVTEAAAAGWRAAGVNRLSLGAQSFDPAALATLGRDHTPADIAAAVAAARVAGFADVGLDLICAVPGTGVATWRDDLARAIALAPEHVSAYCLTYEERTPFFRWRATGRVVPVDEETELAMLAATTAILTAAGFSRYEISNWARPGFPSRHNEAYWVGTDYLGLGPGAHGFSASPAPGRRTVNVRRPDAWAAAVSAHGTAVAADEPLTPERARADFVWTGLRRIAGVDLAEFRRRFDTPLAAAFPHVVDLVTDDLLEESSGRLRLTARGLLLADAVAATFV